VAPPFFLSLSVVASQPTPLNRSPPPQMGDAPPLEKRHYKDVSFRSAHCKIGRTARAWRSVAARRSFAFFLCAEVPKCVFWRLARKQSRTHMINTLELYFIT
jgi:hypothetical protein